MLISKPIGWRGTGNPLAWNAIGLPVTGWISGGAHEVWMMTWTPVLLLSLSLTCLCGHAACDEVQNAWDIGLLGDSALSSSIVYNHVHRLNFLRCSFALMNVQYLLN